MPPKNGFSIAELTQMDEQINQQFSPPHMEQPNEQVQEGEEAQGEQVNQETQPTEEAPEEQTPKVEQTVEEEPEPQQEPEKAEQPSEIDELKEKLRKKTAAYDTLRSKYDAEVPRLHRNIKKLKKEHEEEIRTLQTQIDELKASQQTADTGGPSDLDALAEFGDEYKALVRTIKSQSKEIQDLKDNLKSEPASDKEETPTGPSPTFFKALDDIHPGWREIDNMPEWKEWLGRYCPHTGLRGQARLQAAMADEDAAAVDDMLTEFLSNHRKPQRKKPKVPVTPPRTRSNPSPDISPNAGKDTRTYKQSEVNSFYKRLSTQPKLASDPEMLRLEEVYSQALVEGRVRPG